MGQGFKVSAYRLETPGGPVLVFSGKDLSGLDLDAGPDGAAAAPLVLVEASSWLNQSSRPNASVLVTATARSADEANALAAGVGRWLGTLTLGDPARIKTANEVAADSPEGGTVRVTTGR